MLALSSFETLADPMLYSARSSFAFKISSIRVSIDLCRISLLARPPELSPPHFLVFQPFLNQHE